MAVKGKKDQFWEMRRGGPHDEPGETEQIFKCVGCGAETAPPKGWSGEPAKHHCRPGCRCGQSDLKVGASRTFRNNFDRIFPDAPGAGL